MGGYQNMPFIEKEKEYFEARQRGVHGAELAIIVRQWLATATTSDEICANIFYHYDSVLLGEYALSDDEIMRHACAVFKTKEDWWSWFSFCDGNMKQYRTEALDGILSFAQYKEDVQGILTKVCNSMEITLDMDKVFLQIFRAAYKLPARTNS
ncbi:MAG: hypothetical protein WC819_06050 [Parcubacteria group bacterium]|jgi:hypothetical protein